MLNRWFGFPFSFWFPFCGWFGFWAINMLIPGWTSISGAISVTFCPFSFLGTRSTTIILFTRFIFWTRTPIAWTRSGASIAWARAPLTFISHCLSRKIKENSIKIQKKITKKCQLFCKRLIVFLRLFTNLHNIKGFFEYFKRFYLLLHTVYVLTIFIRRIFTKKQK